MIEDLVIGMPAIAVLRVAVAAVWIYEGLWSKLLGRAAHQVNVVENVPLLGSRFGRLFLYGLGVVEVALGVWILTGVLPGACAVTQTVLLVGLNANGLLWARQVIHDPAGMVLKNAAFLVLAWVLGAQQVAVRAGGLR